MKENITFSSPMFDIFEKATEFGEYYQLKQPYFMNLQTIHGVDIDDYATFLLLSSNHIRHDTVPIDVLLSLTNNRTLHQHDFLEIMVVLKGTVIHRIEGNEYLYPTGSCCLLNRNLRHVEKHFEAAQVFFLCFSTELASEIINSCQNGYFSEELDFLNSPILQFIQNGIISTDKKEYLDFYPAIQNQDSYSKLHKLVDEIMCTTLFPEFGSTFKLKAQLSHLLQYFSNESLYHTSKITLESSSDLLIFSRARHLIENTKGHISRAELEKHLNYTGDYISRIVRKYTGQNLYDYKMNFCLKHACELLTDSNLSISSISEELGFSNRSHFYKLFKEKYQTTPSNYRTKGKE